MRGKINKLIALPLLAVLIIASMPAIVPVRGELPPPVYLYVDGFSASYTDWISHGTSPYLNAPGDGNYVEGTTHDALMGMFSFEDIDPSYFTDYLVDVVQLEGYTNGPYDGDVDFDAYNAAFDWLGSLYANGAPQWVTPRWTDDPTSVIDPSLTSEQGINDFEVVLALYDPAGHGGAGNIVDSIRLMVTFKEKPPEYPVEPVLGVFPEVNTGGVGGSFTIEVIIKPPPYTPVMDLYGIEFRLAFDPNVIMAMGVSPGSFWTQGVLEWVNIIDPSGFVWYSVTMPMGSPSGISGSGTIAVIDFTVVGVGVSGLDLYAVMAGNRYAIPIPLVLYYKEAHVFANEQFIEISLITAYKGKRHVTYPEPQTLEASLMNKAAGRTTGMAQFVIKDYLGNDVAMLLSTPVSLAPNEGTKATVTWSDYPPTFAKYHVVVTALYRDPLGGWSVGHKGSPSGSRTSMSVSFVTEV